MAISNKQRLDLVEAYIREHKYADLHDLADKFQTSLSTIRRTLNDLETAGIIRRHHGGASLLENGSATGYDFITQDDTHADEKRRLAAAVRNNVEDGMTLFIDGGTSTYAVAKALLERRLILITNSLPIAALLNEVSNCETIVTGGTLYNRLGVLCGHNCEATIERMHADLAILGCAGVTAEGIWNSNDLLAGYQRKMVQSADNTLCIADASKLGRRALALSLHYQPGLRVLSTGEPATELHESAAANGSCFLPCP